MEVREAPSTDHDLLVRIWTILEGTNGSGLITRFSCLEKDVSEIKALVPTLWTKEEHTQSIQVYEETKKQARERRKLSRRNWTLISMTVFGPIVAVAVAHFVK